MTVESLALNLLSGLIGAIAGGLLSGQGAVKAVRAAQRDLEADELRRLKLDCMIAIMGLRHALTTETYPGRREERIKMMFELNRAVGLWADNVGILNLLRDVRTRQTQDNVAALLRAMSQDTKQPFDNLANDDLVSLAFLRDFTS